MTRPSQDFAKLILQAMTAGDPDAAFEAPDGKTYHVEMDPAQGIRRQVRSVEDNDGTQFRLTNWSPATDRHEAFPSSAPFLPSVPIMTVEAGEAMATRTIASER